MIQRVLAAVLLASLLAVPALAADTARTTPRANWEGDSDSWSSGTYSYDGAGNIKQIGADIYRYDPFGRLSLATARTTSTPESQASQPAVNKQNFGYDIYGNLSSLTTQTAQGSMVTAFAVNPQTNQLTGTCPGGVDRCLMGKYDPAGNQVGRVNDGEFTWDPLGVMSELHADRPERYVYDANDERILTINTELAYERHRYTLRGAGNKVLRELTHLPSTDTWALAKDYVYRGGTLVASFSGTETQPSRHYHVDHLGSTRLVTDGSAVRLATHTYWPFGQEADGSESDTERMKFTGHERDGEGHSSGFELDYMHARYYDANQGRFLSVDPKYDDDVEFRPQKWNRYSYAANNPLRYVDPDGRGIYDFIEGAANGWTSSNLGNINRVNPRNLDYKRGQMVGDAAAAIQGFYEMAVGGQAAIGGGGATLLSGGSASLVSVPVTAGGVIVAAHGGVVAATALNNLASANGGSSSGSDDDDPPTEVTPSTDKDAFTGMRGRDAKVNKETGEVWVRDRLHKDHWEVYKNQKQYEQGNRTRAVWDDGRLKETF